MIRFAPLMPCLSRLVGGVVCALLMVGAAAAAPPPDDDAGPASVSHAVVEPTAPSASKALNTALGRLAKDPRNIDALLAAGNAAITLGDNEAALGFFSRAEQVAPTNGLVKAAIAGARLHLNDPVEALRGYADAEKAGADPAAYALDRGFAYDLVGDNVSAIAQYRKVQDHSTDAATRDEATRREALSMAIGGDRRGADLLLLPLLQRQDRAAWRTHTFVLAIAGRGDDAVTVARATMPPDLATAIGPYLRFMAQLTPAQQAAVAGLGLFPRAADIGRDDPRVAAYAAAHPRVALVAPAPPVQASAAPVAEARQARARRRRGREAAPTALAAVKPPAEPDIVLPPPPAPPPATALASAAPPPAPVASRTPTPARTGFDLAQVSGSTAPPAPATPPAALVLPRPTVLSRLDLPPQRRPVPASAAAPLPAVTPAAPATATPVVQAIPSSHPVVEPIPAVAAKAPAAEVPPAKVPPPAKQPLPASPATSHSLQTTTAPAKAVKPASSANAPDKTAPDDTKKGKDRASRTKSAKDKATSQTDNATETRAARDKSADKPGGSKSAHGKPAKDEAADTVALAPCKPANPTKGRKGKAATVKEQRGTAARSKTRRGAKANKDATDKDTCAPTARSDRPDGPGEVSRDSDSETPRNAKLKGKGHDKAAERDAEKPAEKGGRHARYASRIWVEVLTGADRDKMPGEWRALVRKAHKLKGRKAYITPWRSNFRLLTGPFDSDADAQDFIAELRKDGVSGFEWTSPAGQAVDSLAVP